MATSLSQDSAVISKPNTRSQKSKYYTSDEESPMKITGKNKFKMSSKKVCFECKVIYLVQNFGVNSFSQLSETSICLFCKFKNQIEMINLEKSSKNDALINKKLENLRNEMRNNYLESRKEIEKYRSKVEELTCKNIELEKEICQLKSRNNNNFKENGFENISQKKVDSLGQKVDRLEQEVVLLQSSKENMEELKFERVSGNRVAKKKVAVKESKIEIKNSFQILQELENETVVIGDSLLRDQGFNFALKNPGKRQVMCLPGARMGRVKEHVNNLKLKNRNSIVVTHVGTNDVYAQGRQESSILKDLEDLAESISRKTNNGIMVGVMPRLNEERIKLEKCTKFNKKMRDICSQKGIQYLDTWEDFNLRSLYSADMVHLNYYGKRKLGNILHEAVSRLVKENAECEEIMIKFLSEKDQETQFVNVNESNDNNNTSRQNHSFQELFVNLPGNESLGDQRIGT